GQDKGPAMFILLSSREQLSKSCRAFKKVFYATCEARPEGAEHTESKTGELPMFDEIVRRAKRQVRHSIILSADDSDNLKEAAAWRATAFPAKPSKSTCR